MLRWASVKDVLEMVTAYDMAEILRDNEAAKDRIQPDWLVFVTIYLHVLINIINGFANRKTVLSFHILLLCSLIKIA